MNKQQQQVNLFLESCRSEETKGHYAVFLEKWFEFTGGKELSKNPREVEDKIIQFILFLKKEGKAYSALRNYIAPIKSFYQINDVILNTKKIDRFIPEYRKVKTDKSYSHEQISRLVEIADDRMKAVILLLASSGIRIGAIADVKLRHLEDENGKLTIYENSKEQYFTFITPECKKAIDSYLDMRKRYGEKLDKDSFLIREQLNPRRLLTAKPRQIKKETLQYKLYDLCRRCGIDKKDIAIGHGFRKFFTTMCVKSKVNPEIREMLLGHKIGIASAYYKPTEEEMYQEYEKAIDNLTINEENRLRKKVETLEIEKSKIDTIALKLQLLEKKFNKKHK